MARRPNIHLDGPTASSLSPLKGTGSNLQVINRYAPLQTEPDDDDRLIGKPEPADASATLRSTSRIFGGHVNLPRYPMHCRSLCLKLEADLSGSSTDLMLSGARNAESREFVALRRVTSYVVQQDLEYELHDESGPFGTLGYGAGHLPDAAEGGEPGCIWLSCFLPSRVLQDMGIYGYGQADVEFFGMNEEGMLAPKTFWGFLQRIYVVYEMLELPVSFPLRAFSILHVCRADGTGVGIVAVFALVLSLCLFVQAIATYSVGVWCESVVSSFRRGMLQHQLILLQETLTPLTICLLLCLPYGLTLQQESASDIVLALGLYNLLSVVRMRASQRIIFQEYFARPTCNKFCTTSRGHLLYHVLQMLDTMGFYLTYNVLAIVIGKAFPKERITRLSLLANLYGVGWLFHIAGARLVGDMSAGPLGGQVAALPGFEGYPRDGGAKLLAAGSSSGGVGGSLALLGGGLTCGGGGTSGFHTLHRKRSRAGPRLHVLGVLRILAWKLLLCLGVWAFIPGAPRSFENMLDVQSVAGGIELTSPAGAAGVVALVWAASSALSLFLWAWVLLLAQAGGVFPGLCVAAPLWPIIAREGALCDDEDDGRSREAEDDAQSGDVDRLWANSNGREATC